MKLLIKALPIAGILALAGCVTLDQAVKDIQTATAPAVVKDTLPQIGTVANSRW